MSDFYFAREAQVTYKRREPGERAVGTPIMTSADAATHLRHAIGDVCVEHFVVLSLDARSRVIGRATIGIGGSSYCPVDVAAILRFALLAGASAIVLGHNHPSGDPAPSREDIILTERIIKASALIGIRVLDHVIVAERGSFSFLDAGILRSE